MKGTKIEMYVSSTDERMIDKIIGKTCSLFMKESTTVVVSTHEVDYGTT